MQPNVKHLKHTQVGRTQMSGAKQHYIPQFLLRNFGERRGNKPSRVFVYPRGQRVFRTATSNIAAERHFYSGPSANGESTLDDEITNFENRITTTLDMVLNSPPTGNLNPEPIAEAVTHLCIRQASFRSIMSQAMEKIADIANTTFTDEKKSWKAFGLDKDRATGQILKGFEELYDNHSLALKGRGFFTKEAFVEHAFDWTKKNFKQNITNQKTEVDTILAEVARFAAQAPREAHIKALKKGLAPTPRAEKLAKLRWRLVRFEAGSLVLPDCIAIGLHHSGLAEPLLFSTDPDFVVMPLRHDVIVIGETDAEASPFSHEWIDRAFAKCSWDFFIARSEAPLFTEIQASIGSGTEDKLNTMFDDIIRDLGW